MAKITVAGDALVLSSKVRLEDYKLIAKYKPSALVLTDEDGDPLFRVSCGTGGDVSEYGVVFPGATREGGYACVTMVFRIPEETDIKDFIADNMGAAIINLEKIENSVPEVLRQIEAERAAVFNKIDVAQ